MRRVLFGLAASAALSACASQRPPAAPPGPGTTQHIEGDKLEIRDRPDPLIGLDAFDAKDVLAKGNSHFDAEEPGLAAKVYSYLVEHFPDSDLVPSALYNEALCYEQLAELDLAAQRYQRIVRDYPDSQTGYEALYRSTFVLGKLDRWQEVADAFWAMRQRELEPMVELEARVGMGIAFFNLEDYETAEREFSTALSFHRRASKERFLPASYLVGKARFHLGEIFARRFERTELSAESVEPDVWMEEMSGKLESKCEQLLRSQNNLIRAIRVGHTGWASAAGYRIGSLYERLYDEMTNVPTPPGLSEAQKKIYTDELRERLGVLVSKAIKIYEQSLEMAARVGEGDQNPWVGRTQQALERMKTLALASIRDHAGTEGAPAAEAVTSPPSS